VITWIGTGREGSTGNASAQRAAFSARADAKAPRHAAKRVILRLLAGNSEVFLALNAVGLAARLSA
jgi:hypothetical protein